MHLAKHLDDSELSIWAVRLKGHDPRDSDSRDGPNDSENVSTAKMSPRKPQINQDGMQQHHIPPKPLHNGRSFLTMSKYADFVILAIKCKIASVTLTFIMTEFVQNWDLMMVLIKLCW